MYRSLWPTFQSMYKFTVGTTFNFILFKCLMKLFPSLVFFGLEGEAGKLLGSEKKHHLQEMVKSPEEIPIYTVLASIALYQHYVGIGLPICAVRYEDLRDNPRYCLQVLFKACELDNDLLPKALEAMSRDSQRGSSLSKANLKDNAGLGEYEGHNKDRVDALCHLFDVATPEGEQLLPNTITVMNTTKGL